MTQIPAYPPPPAGPPKQSGGGGPAPMIGSINITDPGGPGGGGGGSAARRELKWNKKEEEAELSADSLNVGAVDLAPLTLQAALSQLIMNGEGLDTSALMRLLNGQGAHPIAREGREELEPACPFTEIEIPNNLTEAEEIHLRELITDPRSGFAPEGLDAFDIESDEKILLTPLIAGPGDFSEGGSMDRWLLVVLSKEDTAVNNLKRAAKDAGEMKMNLSLNVSANPTPQLIEAIRNIGMVHSKLRIHVTMR